MNKTEKQNLSDALNWRYAVKKFEKREINTEELENTVKEILQQTPTSF
jgi:predicted oxidoreductase (fatty acid repression mutant protein)